MKISLIGPPTITDFDERVVGETEAARLVFEFAPVGILTLAAVMRQQGVEVEVIDLNQVYYNFLKRDAGKSEAKFVSFASERLLQSSVDVFGFSTICGSYPFTIRLAQTIREAAPQTPLIMGGPQASVVDTATLEAFPFIDLVVRGEAEATLPRVLDSLARNNEDLEKIAGITYRENGTVHRNPNAPVIEDLDRLPMPAYDVYSNIKGSRYAPLEAGRGCPFACSFCSTNDFFRRRFRLKTPEVLVDQMIQIKRQYGIDTFDLIHDMFTVDRRKVVSFCHAIKQSGERLYWGCSARTDSIDNELIDVMNESGCIGFFFGIDSGSNRMQTVMQKRLDLSEARERIKHASRRGIKHTVSMIAGFPEETKEDLRATIKFIGESLRHDASKIQLHLLAPLAETPITSQYRDQLIFDDVFSDMSFQGREQDPEERQLIIDNPTIFPNFYGVPTPWLDRQYLREVREFMLHAIPNLRWLLVLLHRDCGDLLRVFDDWRAWSAQARRRNDDVDTSRNYYGSNQFPKDVISFVELSYAVNSRYPHLLKTMAQVELAQYRLKEQTKDERPLEVVFDSLESVPVVADQTRVLIVSADYKRLMRSLKRNHDLESIPVEEVALGLIRQKDQVKVVQLNRTSYELMRLCSGSRTISEIAGKFSAGRNLGVSPLSASLYGLASLARQGLIELQPRM